MKHFFSKTTAGVLGLTALVFCDSQFDFETPWKAISSIYNENRDLVLAQQEQEIFITSNDLKINEDSPSTVTVEVKSKRKTKKRVAAKLKPKKIVKIVMNNDKVEKQLAKIGELTLQRADDAKPFAEACAGFIQRDGHYGKIGKELVKHMSKQPYKSKYMKGRSLSQVCPNYKHLKPSQKMQAWVWFWMVLSNEESSCQVETPHGTHAKVAGRWIRINPKEGYGLFAAELYGGDRQWRGPMCRGNMKTMQVQVSCAVATMHDRHLSKGEDAYTAGSYWGPVRRLDKQIVPNMGLYKPCFDGGTVAAQ